MTAANTVAGKRVLITGGTAGIGHAVAADLASNAANVVVVGRRATAQAGEIDGAGSIEFMRSDLSLMRNVRVFASEYLAANGAPDLLIHCAGGLHAKRTLTAEGAELTYATQYLARQHLNTLLVPHMARGGRVVSVSGGGDITKPLDRANLHGEVHYSGLSALRTISIANDLLGLEMAARYEPLGISSYVYGPGAVRGTGLGAELSRPGRAAFGLVSHLRGSSVEQAARDIVGLTTGEYASGLYQRRLRPIKPAPFAASTQERAAAWQAAEAEIEQLAA